MTTRPERDQDIVESALPAQIDELAVPADLDRLLPWHKPRKQLVRERQWIQLSRRLIKGERNKPGLLAPGRADREVRYLTLPGMDFLDVRQLADVCRELGCALTSTGFESGGEGNRYVARAQMREKSLMDAGHITRHSHTFPRRFEDIVYTSGDAYLDLKRRAPFHIVNIDACGSIAKPEAEHAARLIEALHRIVELQLELISGRWLLFVTTHAQAGAISQQTLGRLWNAIIENANDDEDFRERAENLLTVGARSIREAVQVAATRDGIPFLQVFSLGLAKWFLHMVRGKGWDMQTHVPYCYSTMPDGVNTPSMVCLAFEFLPPPAALEDPFGVGLPKPVVVAAREDASARAVNKIGEMADADVKIRSDPEIRARVTQNLCRGLEEIGYPRSVLAKLCA